MNSNHKNVLSTLSYQTKEMHNVLDVQSEQIINVSKHLAKNMKWMISQQLDYLQTQGLTQRFFEITRDALTRYHL